MERKKIEEQERVLEINGESAIVSASAGSGKTTIMIEKILQYLMKGVKVKNILALTFTNQAASQMKQKLSLNLGKLVETTNRIELASEIDFLPQADISTFHSLYEKIVKKYFYVIGIQPSFEILSNEKLLSLKDEAFLQAVENLKTNSFEKYIELCDVLGKKRSDKAIKERIFKIDNFLSSQYQPEEWIKNFSMRLFENKEKTLQMFFDEVFDNARNLKQKLCCLLEKASGFNEDGLCEHINLCILNIDEILGLKEKELYEKIKGDFSFPKLIKSKKTLETETFLEVKRVKEEFSDFIKKFREYDFGTYENIEHSFESCKGNISELVSLYLDFKSILNSKKFEINCYDFSDLETFCAKILDNEQICEEIKNSYEQIFVDEFQDINPMQYEILKKIAKNNVLYVGDAKQSIYAFRQSDVEIFVDVCKDFEGEGEKHSLPLNCNFRTNKKILDFVNDVFKVLMTEKSCGINYEERAMFKGESENSCEGESVKIIKIAKEEKEKEEALQEVFEVLKAKRNFKDYSLEAKTILREINNIINQKVVLDEQERRINFGDIAILVKNRSSLLKDLVALFVENNVPFVVNDEFDLLSSKEVCLSILILSLCLNQKDDFALAAVMASALGKFSYDDLAQIRLNGQGEFFFEKVSDYAERNSDLISQKILKFNSLISVLRFEIQTIGASAALEKLFIKENFFEFVLGQNGGQLRLERLKQFLAHIEQTGLDFDLFNLVEYLKNIKELKTASVKKCDDNSILITTIHASKGLEFPVVILGECGKDLTRAKPETDDLKIDKNLGIALNNYSRAERRVYDSIFKRIIEINSKKKEIAENLRLLYVALTRAQNKLIITGEVPKAIDEITKESNLLLVKPSYLNYILGAIGKSEVQIEEVSNVEVNEFKIEEENIEPLLSAKENIDFVYPNLNATKLALKTSVSEIAFDENSYQSENLNPNRFYVSEHLSSASTPEEGTRVHEILEKVDFSSCNLEREIKSFNCSESLADTIIKNIELIKQVIPNPSCIFKEKQFMIYASPKEIFGEGEEEKILIQGKFDLISVGEKVVLIDYKYTSISNESVLKDRYRKQLLTYAFAVEKAINKPVDEIYLLSLKNAKLIRIN